MLKQRDIQMYESIKDHQFGRQRWQKPAKLT